MIQLEALAQAGAITLLCDERYAGKLALFGGVEKVRFRRARPARRRARLVVDVERLSARGGWATGAGVRRRRHDVRSADVLRGDLTATRPAGARWVVQVGEVAEVADELVVGRRRSGPR